MAVDTDTVRDTYPIFDAIDDEPIERFINNAKSVINESRYGVHYDRAVLCYTAHLLVSNYQVQLNLGSGLKSLQDETGSASTLYPVKSGQKWLETTQYGLEFLYIQENLLSDVIGINIF